MSLAQLERTTPTLARVVSPVSSASVSSAPADAPDLRDAPVAPRLRAVPDGVEARGFALYVGVDEAKAAAAGIDLSALVTALRALATELVPTAEVHAAVALAPAKSGGRDVDVVRRALQEPTAAASRRTPGDDVQASTNRGVVIDISRKRVTLGADIAPLTFKEFELLQFLVLREGRTIDRAQLIEGLWSQGDDEAPNERTIDVHIRRLRSKLGSYQSIVRTVRGSGYRFDRHADVVVRHSLHAPSPDRV
jgi:DNA-binding winged helix-turn-helix (wHTH) protein